jgi:hypothetical protein
MPAKPSQSALDAMAKAAHEIDPSILVTAQTTTDIWEETYTPRYLRACARFARSINRRGGVYSSADIAAFNAEVRAAGNAADAADPSQFFLAP